MDFSKIEPMYDKVIVHPDKAEEKIGDMILSDEAKDRPRKGTVVAAGPGFYLKEGGDNLLPLQCKVGDRVYFSRTAGSPINLDDGKEYLVMRAHPDTNDILAIIPD